MIMKITCCDEVFPIFKYFSDSEYDMSSMGDNSSQLENNFFINEDSVSSMDIDISVIEKVIIE